MSGRVVLVDLSNLFWSAWHAMGDGPVSTVVESTVTAVGRCVRDGDHGVICLDQGKSFRKAINAEYKANRPEKDAVALEALAKTKERLRKDGRLMWGVDGFEADDVIATAARHASKTTDVLVCSADKDLLQLLGPRVKVLRTYKDWELWTVETFRSKMLFEPYQMQDYLALVGDASDNIKGAKGIGGKKAVELLKLYGDVPGIYEFLAAEPEKVLPNAKPGLSADAKNLIDSKAQVLQALELVRLADVPGITERFQEVYEMRTPEPLVDVVQDEPTMDTEVDFGGAVMVEPSAAQSSNAPTYTAPAQKPTPVADKPVVRDVATTDLARIPFEAQLEPRSADGALSMAKILINSRLFNKFGSPEAAFAAIVRGREMGIGALASLGAFHAMDIGGQKILGMSAHLIAAEAMKDADCEYFMLVETNEKQATYETKHRRHPKPVKMTYTIDMAKRAGLSGGNWEKRPAEMLRKTCSVQLARAVYPGAALGLYSPEEMEGVQ